MTTGRILHLEDEPEWREHVKDALGEDFELHSAKNVEEAASLFLDMANNNQKFDLAIIDISLVLNDSSDKKGFKFIDALEEYGVMEGHNIIILSGYSSVDDNQRVAFRDYSVVDVFHKDKFVEEMARFKQTVTDTIKKTKHQD
jgi:DNA-binding response OmpR family regulator